MNILSSILAVATAGLGFACAHLYSELDAARSRAGPQAAACRKEQAQLAASQRECVAFETDAMQGGERPLLSAAGVNTNAGELLVSENHHGTAGSCAGTGTSLAAARGRELARRHEAASRRIYSGLGQELKLSPEQEGQLLSLLLEQRNEQVETMRQHAGDRAAMTHAMHELRREDETELMTVLGDKYLQFEDFRKSMGERMQTEQVALQLEAANIPLREDQRKGLLAAMVEERDRKPRPAWVPGVPIQEEAAKQQEWQADYEVRVRDRASSVLTSDQLKQYDVYRNLQLAARRRHAETWRQATGAQLAPRPANPDAT